MTEVFVEEPLASPGSAKYLICNSVETQGVFKQVKAVYGNFLYSKLVVDT